MTAEKAARQEQIGDSRPAITVQKDQALPSAEFAKIEKNLASLGFFTPSSKRIKNEKAKTITFTKIVEGKKVEVRASWGPAGTSQRRKAMTQHRVISYLSCQGKVRSMTAVITLLAVLVATMPLGFARGSVRNVNRSGDGGSASGRRASG